MCFFLGGVFGTGPFCFHVFLQVQLLCEDQYEAPAYKVKIGVVTTIRWALGNSSLSRLFGTIFFIFFGKRSLNPEHKT